MTACTRRTGPELHVRPARGWINDPNGIVHHDGRWHVFYQHNPHGPFHDLIHWGHVSGTDLLTWVEHPVAFGPEPGGPDQHGCWSGVFAPGLERPAVVYSGIADDTRQSTVCLRWGSADLQAWSRPQVVARTPYESGVTIMRDPFLFELAGRRWSLVGATLTGGEPAVLLFACDDITDWEYVGVLARGSDPRIGGMPGVPGLPGMVEADIWECPQLVWVEGTPVLVLSPQLDRQFSTVVALCGEVTMEAGVPRFAATGLSRLDAGELFYAPQVVQDSSRPLFLGWVRQEGSRENLDGLAGCLTLPRRLMLLDGRVTSVLAPEVERAATGYARSQWRVTGSQRLPETCRLELTAEGARLTRGQTTLPFGGGMVWLDGDVLEAYPSDGGPPRTERLPGTEWRLTVPDGSAVVVTEVGLPTPG